MEDNNNNSNIKKGRGRPKKIKKEESDNKTTESSLKLEEEEEEEDRIRIPDEAKVERLVSNHSFEPELDDDDDLHKALIESMKEKNNLEEDFLKESEEEYIFQQFILQINIEEIEKRSLSLPQFTKRLGRLCFSESDRSIKAIIEPIIVEYKLNKCNNVMLEHDIYINIYENFIDTLYKKPISLGKTATAITKDEDILIRQIFLKKE
jgi:actin-related protein